MFLDLFDISGGFQELRSIVRHAFGRLSEEEKGFIPEMEHSKNAEAEDVADAVDLASAA